MQRRMECSWLQTCRLYCLRVFFCLCSSYKNNLCTQLLSFHCCISKGKQGSLFPFTVTTIKTQGLTQYCLSDQTERATCCTLAPFLPFLRPCPWSSHSPLDTLGSTTFPWAYDEDRRRRNGTTLWDIRRYRSRSSHRTTPVRTGSTWVHLDRWANLGVTLLSLTSPLTVSSSWKMFLHASPAMLQPLRPLRDPCHCNFPDFLHFSGAWSAFPRPCLRHLSSVWPPLASCRGGQVCQWQRWLLMWT